VTATAASAERAIFHIASEADWAAARAAGAYRAASLDREGFIHCSTAAQVLGVANAFYRGRTDLVLLRIDPAGLTSRLRFEPPADPSPAAGAAPSGELFPHVYGPLNLDAVVATIVFRPRADGTFALPDVP
jgi:uncharacterized protein (DUF952 family)